MSRRRRRQTRPAFSLFAFQDIIMATSGVVIMIVLLLTLELVDQQETQHADSPPTDFHERESIIAGIEKEIDQLRRQLQDSNSIVLQASTVTPEELKHEITTLKDQNLRLTSDIESLSSQVEIVKASEQQVNSSRKEMEIQKDRLENLVREQARLEDEIESIENDDRPVFTLPRGEQRSGWIVVISDQKIEVAPIGQAVSPTRFESDHHFLTTTTAVEKFLDWANSIGERGYFFLLVRPDGAECFDEISSTFDIRNTRYGFDLAAKDQVLLDPILGAGQ